MFALVKLLFYMIYMDIQYSSNYIERIYKYTILPDRCIHFMRKVLLNEKIYVNKP